MKRYMLFQFDMYYPCGGFGDFKGSFDSIELALENLDKDYKYYQVVDGTSGTVVAGIKNY